MKGPMPSQSLEMLMDNNLESIAWVKGNTDLYLDEISDTWIPSTNKEKELYSYYKYTKNSLKDEIIEYHMVF